MPRSSCWFMLRSSQVLHRNFVNGVVAVTVVMDLLLCIPYVCVVVATSYCIELSYSLLQRFYVYDVELLYEPLHEISSWCCCNDVVGVIATNFSLVSLHKIVVGVLHARACARSSHNKSNNKFLHKPSQQFTHKLSLIVTMIRNIELYFTELSHRSWGITC